VQSRVGGVMACSRSNNLGLICLLLVAPGFGPTRGRVTFFLYGSAHLLGFVFILATKIILLCVPAVIEGIEIFYFLYLAPGFNY